MNVGIDVIPTLCGLAGITTPPHLKGIDWSQALQEEALTPQREALFIETEFGTFGSPSGFMGRCVRSKRWKYSIFNDGSPREMLIDMETDPGETKNLLFEDSCSEVLIRHRELLIEYIKESDDIFPLELIPS